MSNSSCATRATASAILEKRLFARSHAFSVTEFGDWDLYSYFVGFFVVIFGACATIGETVTCLHPVNAWHFGLGKFWRFHCPRTRKGHFSSCSAAKIFPELAQVVSLLVGQTPGEIPFTLIVPTSLFSSTECNFCHLLHVRSILDLFILFIVVFSHFRPRDGTLWDVRLNQKNYLESGLFARYEFCRNFVLFNLLFNILLAILQNTRLNQTNHWSTQSSLLKIRFKEAPM